MSDRAYTVHELDALRRVCEYKWLFGTYGLGRNSGMSRSYKPEEKTACVEQIVRTHMMAGHTAEDLCASERPANQTDEQESA